MASLAALTILGGAPALDASPASPAASEGVGPLRAVETLTGPDSTNPTATRYGVDGTELGHSFVYGDGLFMVFGDTFGPSKSDWCSNVAAVITDDDPSDGLSFDRMIDAPGHAKALIT